MPKHSKHTNPGEEVDVHEVERKGSSKLHLSEKAIVAPTVPVAGQSYDVTLPGTHGNRVHGRGYYINLYMTDFDVQIMYSKYYDQVPPSIARGISTTDKIYEIADLPGGNGKTAREELAGYREPTAAFTVGGLKPIVVEDWVAKANGYNSFLSKNDGVAGIEEISYKDDHRYVQSKEIKVPLGKKFGPKGVETFVDSDVGADFLTRLLGGRR